MELNDGKIKVLAYYLPQFHPTKENDEWWGKGFTEWINVGKAKPLFKGHYQPKVPADLGYYDLRVPEVAEQQATLACEAGVTGFVYWHYWFGNGKKLLEMPAERMLETSKPDFPFCFAWANHSWYQKTWDPNSQDKLLVEQFYPGIEDIDAHFYYCLPFFKDDRYMYYDGRPVFMVFNLLQTNLSEFVKRWNYLIKKEGVAESFYFIANSSFDDRGNEYKKMGFDSIIVDVYSTECMPKLSFRQKFINLLRYRYKVLKVKPEIWDYREMIKRAWQFGVHDRDDVIPQIMPNWDHTPRSGMRGKVYVNATPDNFAKMAMKVFAEMQNKKNKLLILKSWNEWGEGNYMEPDFRYGHGFIEALRESLDANVK